MVSDHLRGSVPLMMQLSGALAEGRRPCCLDMKPFYTSPNYRNVFGVFHPSSAFLVMPFWLEVFL